MLTGNGNGMGGKQFKISFISYLRCQKSTETRPDQIAMVGCNQPTTCHKFYIFLVFIFHMCRGKGGRRRTREKKLACGC